MDELRLDHGMWVAEREDVRAAAACGQEALLRLGIKLWQRGIPPRERLIRDEVQGARRESKQP